MIETAIYQLLDELAGTYPNFVPPNAALPAVTYQRLSTTREMTHSGRAGVVEARFQITIHASQHSEAMSFAAQVRNLLDGRTSGLGAEVGLVEIVNEYDLGLQSETGSWQYALDAMLHYTED